MYIRSKVFFNIICSTLNPFSSRSGSKTLVLNGDEPKPKMVVLLGVAKVAQKIAVCRLLVDQILAHLDFLDLKMQI